MDQLPEVSPGKNLSERRRPQLPGKDWILATFLAFSFCFSLYLCWFNRYATEQAAQRVAGYDLIAALFVLPLWLLTWCISIFLPGFISNWMWRWTGFAMVAVSLLVPIWALGFPAAAAAIGLVPVAIAAAVSFAVHRAKAVKLDETLNLPGASPEGKGAAARPPTSRLASISLILGLASILGGWMTAIPAVALGMAALWEIKKSPTALGGRGVALGGIVIGSLFFLICGAVSLLPRIMQSIQSNRPQAQRPTLFPQLQSPLKTTSDKDEVFTMARRIGKLELPVGLQPDYGLDNPQLGVIHIRYVDRRGRSNVILTVIRLEPVGLSEESAASWIKQDLGFHGLPLNGEGTRSHNWTIGGQPVTVTETFGAVRGRKRAQQFVAWTHAGRVRTTMSCTIAEPDDHDSPGSVFLTGDDVRRIFESFRPE